MRTNLDEKKVSCSDVLFITPPCIDLYEGMRAVAPVYPPFGLAYIASVLEQQNINVKILDSFAEKLDFNEIFEYVRKTKPRIVGLTATTFYDYDQ
jgi:anaerobic magnesium-protoporphyrin IX monomethyl ester cyclase